MNILQNKTLTATIASKGAELQKLVNIHTGINYLWKGDPAFWGKYSPVLFPIVGNLKNDTYIYNGLSYNLPRHGFARDKKFVAEQINDMKAIFTLTDDESTKAVFPFSFTLQLIYELNEDSLSCTYEVYNSGTEEMLFSIGAHPAFAVPLVDGLNYDDYTLTFNQPENLLRYKLKDGLIDEKTAAVPLQKNKLPLSHDLFYDDAIVLKNLNSNCISLKSDKSPNGFHFRFNEFDFFGIWATKNAPFVCLEPWCGIADSVNHNQLLSEKEGINRLNAGETFTRSWSVECF